MIVRRIAIVGAIILSMRGYYFMEKLCIMNCAPKVGHNGIHYEEC